MARLIDADALLETLQILYKSNRSITPDTAISNVLEGVCSAILTAIEVVQDAPTIDAVPVWVSVKDRLPNDGQDVLAYLYNGEETRIAPFNYDKGTWYDCVMNCTVAINSITHWMPLPEPPNEVIE